MAEVPPHLLDRSRARRAALGLESGADALASGGAVAPAPTPLKAAPSAEVAIPKAAAPAAAAATAVLEPVLAAPRGLMMAKMGSVFFLIAMPIWALFMVNSFTTPKSLTLTPADLGASIFAANCTTCHLSNGAGKDGGGIGRPLWHGQAELTFADPVAQLAFVKHGSCGVGVAYGEANREGGQHKSIGGMPAFTGVLTDEEILDVISYERSVLSGKDFPTDLFAKVGASPDPARVLAPGAPATTIAPVSTDAVCG